MHEWDSNVEQHFRETEKLVRDVPCEVIAEWLLKIGYFPEPYVLPPIFISTALELQNERYNKDIKSLARRKLTSISYPKTLLSARQFSIQHPWNYHDIVLELITNWSRILDILYSDDLKIFSYSMPIPVTKSDETDLSDLRAGRMIYEWIRMAEKDLVIDATRFSFIAKTDISNFYSSIYTHSIAWAIEGRDEAYADKDFTLPGSIIDRLVQYANDGRTNGIPVGSGLSDLVAEIILSELDTRVSKKLVSLEFLAVRFKDDYRILCQNENDAKKILSTLAAELETINLVLGEKKTSISNLPHGLYRAHDRQYFPHSLKYKKKMPFKTFEHTLLIALDVHREHPGTSVLEKFLSELLSKKNELKLRFSDHQEQRGRELMKFISLLFLMKRESQKLLSHVLALVQLVYLGNRHFQAQLKPYIRAIVEKEIQQAADINSAFDAVWYVFFSRYLGLGITNFAELLGESEVRANEFVKCVLTSQSKLYAEAKFRLFKKPADCKDVLLVDWLDIFRKNEKG